MRFLTILVSVGLASVAVAAPPNVILILTDDLGINDLACYGRQEHRTPNLDQLAREGARFTNAYAAASICSPTRAALLTGHSPAKLHLTTFLPGRLDAPSQQLLHPKIAQNLGHDAKTLAKLLNQAGYTTACFGKWHLGGPGHQPTDYGFQSHYPGKANTPPTETEGGKGEFDLTNQVIQFLKVQGNKPFFAYLAHNTPHIPYTAPAELVNKNSSAFEPTYAAVIESLDATIGLLLKALADQKLAENTLVIFTSDNGGLHVPELKHTRITHNKPYRAGKGFLYEGGLRVPLMIRWPASVKANQVINTPVISHDLYATILEGCGVEAPAREGVSLVKHLKGEPLQERNLYWHQPHYTNQGGRPSGAIRLGDWKLIEHYEDGVVELFDLKNAPGELKNVATENPVMRTRALEALHKWRTDVQAQKNEANPKFDATKQARLYKEFDPSKYDPTDATQLPTALAWRNEMDAITKPKN
jgi:arylsulfatase A